MQVLPHALDLLLDRSVKKFHQKIQGGETDIKKHVGHTCTHRHDVEGHTSQTGQSVSLDTPGNALHSYVFLSEY